MSVLEVENVSIRYMTGDFKEIGLKEYVMKRLKKQYQVTEFWADRGISFRLEKGDMLGIIGTNGAGKSTLLKAVAGIMEPTVGWVHREGNIAALLELASGFDGDLTVRENTYLRGAMLGYTRHFMEQTYDQIIDFAELRDFQDRPFRQLSSGMKSRLAFAIASLVQPDILILDEVLSVGDGAFQSKSAAKMREIIQGGATTILVSHSIGQVRELCNKVLWLHKGEQVAFGENVQEICDQYQAFLSGKGLPEKQTTNLPKQAVEQLCIKEQPRIEKKTAPKFVFKRAGFTLLQMCAVLLLSICLGTALLCAAYTLPTAPMHEHMKESVPIVEEEGPYLDLLHWCSSKLDTWTDPLMMLISVYDGNEPVLEKALLVSHFRMVDEKPFKTFLGYYSSESHFYRQPYPRYWCGWLIWLKPLLSVMNYREIRIVNSNLQMALVGCLLGILWKKGLRRYVLPSIFLLGLLPLSVTGWSLQFSNTFYVFMICSCIFLWRYEKWNKNKILFFFLSVGILTAYFDFLTYPLVSFGIPMCFYFCMKPKLNFLKSLKEFILYGFSWGMGYAGMWSGKWVVASLFTDQNVILDAVNQIGVRSSATNLAGDATSVFEVIAVNCQQFMHNPCFALSLLFCAVILFVTIKNHRLQNFKNNLIFLLIALTPFLWYSVLTNHSSINYFFTYKELVITAFALMCFLVKSAEPD